MPEFVGKCVEVYCQQFDVEKAHLSKREVGTPFAEICQEVCLGAWGSLHGVRRAVLQWKLHSVAPGRTGLKGERSGWRIVSPSRSSLDE
eukprot:318840-Alexandrium_andersonii.AAC.1